MNNRSLVKIFQITNEGGPFKIGLNEQYDYYRITTVAHPTLAANVTFTTDDTPVMNDRVEIVYEAAMNILTNKLTIFDRVITKDEAACQFRAICTYNGTGWSVILNSDNLYVQGKPVVDVENLVGMTDAQIIVSNDTVPAAVTMSGDATIDNTGELTIADDAIIEDKIANNAVTTNKIASDSITPILCNSTVRTNVIPIIASFETDEVGEFSFMIPYNCTINYIEASVIKSIAGTDDGTVYLKDNGGTQMTGSELTITAGTALGSGTTFSSLITANNSIAALQSIKINTSKSTAGGRILLSISVVKS